MIRALGGALALLAAAPAPATDQVTPIGAGWQPTDKDERGLWLEVDELERKLRTSAFVMRDPALNAYVRGVFCRLVGEAACAPVRIYILRTPVFNAGMYPTGMMVINSGLLLRMRSEAQLAAILGHEYTHYTNRHVIQGFRDLKRKTSLMTWLALVPVGGYAVAAALTAAQLGMIASVFTFSRGMETEADAGSVPLMQKAGYDPAAAWRVWEQLRAEQDATAAARRRKSRKDADGGMFNTHPPTAERLAALKELAAKHPLAGPPDDGAARYAAALRPWWPALVDDQVKLNDFGATDFVLGKLAEDGWTPDLLYARGELYRSHGDLAQAAGFYRQATEAPGAPPEAWRGLGIVALRSGDEDGGRAALGTYLKLKPDAADRSMIAMMAGETN
ncbi:M48 family metalloprotease [Sphingomonas sp. CL5.1]|uniref:M48 family metallopeptidase n=1 Tax=Sphingomonas sp. CL5.1 TaxID=2653203 RepID=UPI001581C60A|nr:M48 family metallopeptidase [Sphingomonas sp. CL5.1]QKS00123.1 M48 family metalloprotease [Sphingomonas sp. CL5.1]